MKRTGCWLVLLAVVPVVHQKMPCDTLIADARAPSEPNGILISVRAPVEAVVSEPFTIDIQISNRRSDDDYVLEDIDIEDTYFEGFEVVRMKPIPEEFDRIEGLALTYNFRVPPGRHFIIELRPFKVGIFTGDLDLWSGGLDELVTLRLQTEVTEPEGVESRQAPANGGSSP